MAGHSCDGKLIDTVEKGEGEGLKVWWVWRVSWG